MSIFIGSMLHGFCGGHFGRDSYGVKRVESMGADWVVAREVTSEDVVFARCSPADLEPYAKPGTDTGCDCEACWRLQ